MTKASDNFELDVDVVTLKSAHNLLVARLRGLIIGAGSGPYDPGHIAGVMADIRALEGIEPTSEPASTTMRALTREEADAAQKRAHDAHKAERSATRGKVQ